MSDPPTQPPEPSRLVTEIARLTAEARKAREAAERVVPDVEAEKKRGRITRILLAVVAALAVAAAPIGWLTWQASQRAERAAADQERVTQRALCPFFALVIGSYSPESRPEGPARDTYVEQFKQIRAAYAELECRNPLVPPPTRR